MKTFRIVCLVASLVMMPPSLLAKGFPQLIMMSGGPLSHPVEITDRSSLNQFSPWAGSFANWKQAVPQPPCAAQAFDVLFYMKWQGRRSAYDRGDMKMIYGTRYCRDGNAGYVYLPGRGEPYFDGNQSTIMRQQYEGKWYRATAGWQALMSRAGEPK